MILAIVSIVLIYATGGNIKNLNKVKVNNSFWALVILLAVELVVKLGASSSNIHIVHLSLKVLPILSMIIPISLVVVLGLHKYLKYINVVQIGALLNGLAIIFNNGMMPVSGDSLIRLGMSDTLSALENNLMYSHVLLTEDTRFKVLSDIIPVKYPVPNVISIGDIFIFTGIVLFLMYYSKER